MSDLLNHPLISKRYFFPRKGTFADPFLVICNDGTQLACSYHEVDPRALTLVHFHGNGEIVDDWQGDFVDIVQQMGCNLFLAELRGYGQSGGTPQLGKMLDDVVPTIQALKQPQQQLIFFGRSVGSIFALEAAAQFPHARGLILESGVADVIERLLLRITPAELGIDRQTLQHAVDTRLNHQQKLRQFQGPVLVLHTRHDGLVDVSHAQRLYDWAAEPKQLKIFAQGNHNDILLVNAREYLNLVAEFIAALKSE